MDNSNLRFDGQVVLVTGAGGGLGKAYALLFGSRGAKVVVNDLGGSPHGEGSDARLADLVVNEINAKGGVAVADYNSVEDGSKIIQTALDNFGRIDIVVNNAGILRDRSFARISDTDWDLVQRVHLRGSFMVTRAAWPHMKKQKFGRIIMTSSAAGLYGNFGQGNYSAAKLGLVGLSNTLAIEGRKYNIKCNTLVPLSGTRLTEGIIPEDMFNAMTPESVAPLVVWLCHKECEENGGIFSAAQGWFGQYRLARSKGFLAKEKLSDEATPEMVRDNWDKISDFRDAHHLAQDGERALNHLISKTLKDNEDKFRNSPSGQNKLSGPLALVGREETSATSYELRDVILYALGVGVSKKDKDGLKFLFEGDENFSVLPTFAIIPNYKAEGGLYSNIPGWNIDFTKLLHGEQYIKLYKPLPVCGDFSVKRTVVDVLDKGSGALILTNFELIDEQENLVASGQMSAFIVGDGKFGGPRASANQIPVQKPPTRPPDAVVYSSTSVDQAALYRLCGDRNPLHISPDFAAAGGFKEPILHGLCTYGISARAVLQQYCNNDVSKFKAIMGRFASPVIPGQTLETSMWKEGSRVFYVTKVKETGKVCISGGYVDIDVGSAPAKMVTGDDKLKTSKFFKTAAANTQVLPYKGQKMLLVWNVISDGDLYNYTFDFRQPSGFIYSGIPIDGTKPTGSVTVDDETLISIFMGEIDPSKAFLTGKMKLSGNIPDIRPIFKYFIPQSQL